MLARFGLSLAVAAVFVLSVVGSATASVTSVQFSRGAYVAPLGQVLTDPISVTVEDENGNPVPGVQVAFSVTPNSTGATATISASTATTDSVGVAQVTGTAGAQGGFPTVHATVGGVSVGALIVNRPPGYRPGEQLASHRADRRARRFDVRHFSGRDVHHHHQEVDRRLRAPPRRGPQQPA